MSKFLSSGGRAAARPGPSRWLRRDVHHDRRLRWLTASASIVQLPPGAQVNDDLAANTDKSQDAAVRRCRRLADRRINVPATFEQKHGASQQIFVRSFAGGAWKTRARP
jgi:hypothetical protein